MATATFAAGCFWGVEEAFRRLPGVIFTEVGYSGGNFPNPSYEDVCSHKTGHAEVVRIEYDPARISYVQLLAVFWQIHNPTQLNGQGVDRGSQYRSAIFFHTPEQEQIAKKAKDELQTLAQFSSEIVTEILPIGEYYKAEEYHQQYFKKLGIGACHIPEDKDK